MRMLAGPNAHVQFTNLSKSSCDFLVSAFKSSSSTTQDTAMPPTSSHLSQFSCHQIGVLDLMKASDVLLEKVCLLDPKADKELSPEDGDGCFQWFLFGVM